MLRAAFVSVLKPVDDIRLFQKIARTWQEAGYEIHSIGFEADTQNEAGVFFYPVFKFRRLQFKRLFVGWQILFLLLKIRPQSVVCGSIELLPFCVLFKLLHWRKVRIVYDIQENYFLNILHTQVYPKFIRYPLALFIRLTERFFSYGVDCFLLAERCYEEELTFLGKRHIILENKPLEKFFKEIDALSFSYTLACVGTIAQEYGIWKGLAFFEQIQRLDARYKLHIMGRCMQDTLFSELRRLQTEDVSIHISQTPIAYQLILDTMQQADAILMPYELNRSYEKRIPTKFYEAMALSKWIIVSENPYWQTFFERINYPKVIFIHFGDSSINFQEILEKLQHPVAGSSSKTTDFFWETERQKLLAYLQK